eukprot:1391407-Amphidinium_carterae.1
MAPGEWVTDEPIPGYPVGSRLDPVPAGLVNFGGRAFVTVSGKLATVSFIEAGVDVKVWLAQRTSTLSCGDTRVLPLQDVSRTGARAQDGTCSSGYFPIARAPGPGGLYEVHCATNQWRVHGPPRAMGRGEWHRRQQPEQSRTQ